MGLYEETEKILKKYGIRANKSLGQNFLISDNVVENIIEKSMVNEEDLVIEIGPGLGNLTKYLAEKAYKVICIELDERMLKILEDRFKEKRNIEVIHNDVLKVDLEDIILKNKEQSEIKNVKVIANLPYYITTPIIMKLLEEKLSIDSITVMVQKEVADRLVEIPGGKNTGAITYAINYYTQPQKLFDVPKESFIPEPEVTSAVIKLDIRKEKEFDIENEDKFFKVIKGAFLQKRKTLSNSLVNSGIFENKKEVEDILNKLNLDLNIRGEKLSIEQFAEISKYVK